MGSGSIFTVVGTSVTTTFLHTGLTPPGVTVLYKLSAINDVGESDQSTQVGVMLATIPAVPAAPTKLSADLTSITIQWAAPDNGGTPILSYKVQINSGPAQSYLDAGTVTGDTTTFKATGLTTGQEYKFKVKASNAVGESNYSP
jgi:hypothetical protein